VPPAARPQEGIMSPISTNPFRIFAAVALLSWLADPVIAQPAGTMTFEFPIQATTVTGGPDQRAGILSGSGSIEHWFAQDRARVFYELAVDRFRTEEEWDTWLHNAGAVRTFAFGDTRVNTGAAAFWRVNSGGWADASFRGVNLQSTVERTLSRGGLTAAYNLYLRTFTDAPALDQMEHHGSLRGRVNLQSRTTLVGILSSGWKRYDGDPAEMIEVASGGATRGRGRAAMLLNPTMSTSRSQPATRTLWTWSARVAQSLDDRTGVWVEREQRRANGDAPPALVWTPPLFYDDGVYDDPYVVESRSWRAGARRVFARGDELAIRIDRSVRDFDGLDVLDDAGIAMATRSDTLLRSGIDAEIVIRSTPAVDLILLAGYGYVRNTSKDEAETYRSQIGSIGLSIRF
jgi:hypothetical protein